MTDQNQDQYDIPWKQALERLFPKFTQFFFPLIYQDIDWDKPLKQLNNEIQPESADAVVSRRYVDHLVEVSLKNGEKGYILIHTEIQCQRDETMIERLQDYIARIRSIYGKWPVTLVILGDDVVRWRPRPIKFEKWTYELSIKIPTVKLLDMADSEDQLYQSDNPFALVVLAHLATMNTKHNPTRRVQIKKHLIGLMLKKNFTPKEIATLTNFLDWCMKVPDIENNAIWTEAKAEYQDMEYLAPIFKEQFDEGFALGEAKSKDKWLSIGEAKGEVRGEVRGISIGEARGEVRGISIGEIKGKAGTLLRLLTKKFGPLPDTVSKQISQASSDQLDRWLDNLLDGGTLDQILS